MLHESITERILKAAIKVHTVLGAGMLESAYHTCLQYQLGVEGLHFQHQVRLPVVYQGIHLDEIPDRLPGRKLRDRGAEGS
jgi:GxxExxY protein